MKAERQSRPVDPREDGPAAQRSYNSSRRIVRDGTGKEMPNNVRRSLSSSGGGAASGALSVFPQNVGRTVVLLYSNPGDTVFDPFAGHASRLALCVKEGRHYIGCDLSAEFMQFNRRKAEELRRKYPDVNIALHECDSREVPVDDEMADMTLSSPPYWNIEHYGDEPEQLGKCKTYLEFLEGLGRVLRENFRVLKPGAYAAWYVNDFRRRGRMHFFHCDVLRLGEEAGFIPHDLMVVDLGRAIREAFPVQVVKDKILPKRHEFGIIFRKPASEVNSDSVSATVVVGPERQADGVGDAPRLLTDFNALTPVEKRGDYLFKRDDLFQPFDEPLNGGKVRQALSCLIANQDLIRREFNSTVATVTSVHSPQGYLVACCAHSLGLKTLIGLGVPDVKRAVKKHPPLQGARELGAELVSLAKIGYNSTLQPRLEKLAAERGYFPMHFGIKFDCAANAHQVENLPKVNNLVIPCGSGVTATAILQGLSTLPADRRPGKVWVVQIAGHDRRKAIGEPLAYEFVKDKTYDYSKRVKAEYQGLEFDQVYEAKAFKWLLRKKLKGSTLFWVIGNFNGLR
jgi:1-aminocyclopropane-1-carboxylate deaminase/D-cysteine desulfhydrase-like pyridoxal-dependent ACC family enzyme